MSYCPKCHHEYAENVITCVECGRPLRKGRRPVSYALELEDVYIPIGALICGLVALALLWLRIAAGNGWLQPTLATLVETTQPPCMTAFYAIAVVACVIVTAAWVFRVIIRRE
jgi:hypothetical protein